MYLFSLNDILLLSGEQLQRIMCDHFIIFSIKILQRNNQACILYTALFTNTNMA